MNKKFQKVFEKNKKYFFDLKKNVSDYANVLRSS